MSRPLKGPGGPPIRARRLSAAGMAHLFILTLLGAGLLVWLMRTYFFRALIIKI